MTEWGVAKPEAAGLRGEVISAVGDWLDSLPCSNVHGIAVARNGRMAFEHYRRGEDERWRQNLGMIAHGRDVMHDVRSVTKVVTGLLFGDAVARGLIRDLEIPVLDLLPEYSDLRSPGKNRIRLRHLLTMSSGLEWDENLPPTNPRNGEVRLAASKDPLRTTLESRLLWEPGAVWNYSGGCTELLGAALGRNAIGFWWTAPDGAGPRQDRPARGRSGPLEGRAAFAGSLDRAVADAADRRG